MSNADENVCGFKLPVHLVVLDGRGNCDPILWKTCLLLSRLTQKAINTLVLLLSLFLVCSRSPNPVYLGTLAAGMFHSLLCFFGKIMPNILCHNGPHLPALLPSFESHGSLTTSHASALRIYSSTRPSSSSQLCCGFFTDSSSRTLATCGRQRPIPGSPG